VRRRLVDRERTAVAGVAQLGTVLVGQEQLAGLGAAVRPVLGVRARALLHLPQPLGVAQEPDDHAGHDLLDADERDAAGDDVDALGQVRELAQDGVLGVLEKPLDLIVGDVELATEPAVGDVRRGSPGERHGASFQIGARGRARRPALSGGHAAASSRATTRAASADSTAWSVSAEMPLVASAETLT